MKRTFTFLLALLMLISMLPTTAFATEEPEETVISVQPVTADETPAEPPKKADTTVTATGGKCGDDLFWEYDAQNNIVISGTGPMYDYSEAEPAPWADIKPISYIYVRDGVTRIGNYAFSENSLSTIWVAFPKTVQEVGSHVFAGHSIYLTFLGGACAVAEDAFTQSRGTVYYRAGWRDEDRQTYGSTNLTWTRFDVDLNKKTKKFYRLGEPILAEDIYLTAKVFSGYAYTPQEIQTSAYDNSTPGKKSVQVLADGFSFTHE